MNCPACNRELKEKPVSGIKVDVCENGCGGIWFDNFELKKVDEKHEAIGEDLLKIEDENITQFELLKVKTANDLKLEFQPKK